MRKINKDLKEKEKRDLDFSKVNWEKAKKIFEPEKERLLDKLKKEADRYPYVKEVLVILAAGVFVSACVVMPGLPLAIKPLVWNGGGYKKKRFNQVFKRFYKHGLVEVVKIDGETVLCLTQEGRIKALNLQLDEIKIKKPLIWDRKWRVIVFDIPENLKTFRDIFRERLKNMGFYRLQDSVFVHPYPCFEQIEFLRRIYKVEIGVTYIQAEQIEGQDFLREFFEL